MATYKVGDQVTIYRKCTNEEAPTWGDSWYNKDMDPLIGKSGVITDIRGGTRYYITFDGLVYNQELFNFPAESFEPAIVIPKEDRICIKIKQMEGRWKTFQFNKTGGTPNSLPSM